MKFGLAKEIAASCGAIAAKRQKAAASRGSDRLARGGSGPARSDVIPQGEGFWQKYQSRIIANNHR
ncbi:MAG: hypothetical protein ACREOO_19115 [bacterium]